MTEAKKYTVPQDPAIDAAVFAQQHKWIKEGGTGCVFSQVLTQRRENGSMRWTNLIDRSTPEKLMRVGSGGGFIDSVRRSIAEGKDELFSTIFPNVNTPQGLAGLVAYLGEQAPFHIDEIATGRVREDNPNLYHGIYLRIRFDNGTESWPLMLGPYEFFSPSRRAPYTQLIFRPIPEKSNPTTPQDQVGIDDVAPSVTQRTFQHLLNKTILNVAETRGDYNQELFRARVAVVVPQREWEQAQTRLGIRY